MEAPSLLIELPAWYVAMCETEAANRARWERESQEIDDLLEVVEDGGD